MTDRGWCPFANQHRAHPGPFGYPKGAEDQNRPLCFVDHRMGGYKRTLDNDAWRHDNSVGVHAGVGRDGSLDQYASIFDASWGNGVSGDRDRYDRSNAALAEIEAMGRWSVVRYAGTSAWTLTAGGVNVINTHTISTEHEDENEDQPWTPAQIETTIRWKRWCLEELNRYGIPMPVRDATLAGHFQIDAVNRPGCPGDNWPRAQILAAIAGQEDEMWTRLNGIANWWSPRTLLSGGTMQLGADFPQLPESAKAVDIEVFLDPTSGGKIIFYDGDGDPKSGRGYAGQVSPLRPETIIRVVPKNRTCIFAIEGKPRTTLVGVVGYLA